MTERKQGPGGMSCFVLAVIIILSIALVLLAAGAAA